MPHEMTIEKPSLKRKRGPNEMEPGDRFAHARLVVRSKC